MYPHEQEEFDTLDDQFRVSFVLVTNDVLYTHWTDFDDDFTDIDEVIQEWESKLGDKKDPIITFAPDPANFELDPAPRYVSLNSDRVLFIEYSTRRATEGNDDAPHHVG